MTLRVLITGAAGRIGRAVVQRLRESGHTVRGLDVRPCDADELVVGNLLDPRALEAATRDIDAIVHLAALMRWDAGAEDALFEQNVVATHRLLCAAPPGIRRFVFASSGEVYPERKPGYLPIDETHPLRPDTAYGLSKLLGEEMVRQRMRTGLPTVIVRLAHTQAAEELLDPSSLFSGPRFFVGPRLRALQAAPQSPDVVEAIRRLQAVQISGDQLLLACGEDGTPYRMGICDVRDAALGIMAALEHSRAVGEAFNIGPERAADFGEIVPSMARLIGLPMVRVALPLPGYFYETSIQKAQAMIGYQPQFTIFRMIDEAASRHTASSTACG